MCSLNELPMDKLPLAVNTSLSGLCYVVKSNDLGKRGQKLTRLLLVWPGWIIAPSGTNIRESPGLEGIDVKGVICACNRHGRCTQPYRLNFVDAVVDTGQVCLLDSIYPESQMTVVAPIDLYRMHGIRDWEIRRVDKNSRATVMRARTQLVGCAAAIELDRENDLTPCSQPLEQGDIVPGRHGDRVRIAIEPSSVACLGSR